MWKLDNKKGWVSNNWCFQNVLVEKTIQSPLDSKEIKPVNPKGNQGWIFIGRTDAEVESLILWLQDSKTDSLERTLDAAKNWRQEKGMTEDEMVGWHHWLNGHELQQTPGDGIGQGSLARWSPLGCRVGYDWVTEQQKSKMYSTLKCEFHKVILFSRKFFVKLYWMHIPWANPSLQFNITWQSWIPIQ